MAQITICDLCKNKMSNVETERGALSLFRFGEDGEEIYREIEICASCAIRFHRAIDGDMPFDWAENFEIGAGVPAEEELLEVSDVTGRIVRGPRKKVKITDPTNPGSTNELLSHEIVRVPPSRDLSKGSREAAKLNKEIENKKGSCPHHFKAMDGATPVCADAPPGTRGPFSSFKGCGKKLSVSEL